MRRLSLRIVLLVLSWTGAVAGQPFGDVLERVQLAAVKVYGAGGIAGLEAYQTGYFVDSAGAVLTVDSPLLGGRVTLVDTFGDRHEGSLLAQDAASGLALIAYPDSVTPPGGIDLSAEVAPRPADPVWVVSNAFGIAAGDEPLTVQRGRVALTTRMPVPQDVTRPRIGVPHASTSVLLLDAVTSNPGAAGGLVIDDSGQALGVLGAECRSSLTGAWINYALPAAAAAAAIEKMRGNPTGDRSGASRAAVVRWRAALRDTGLALIPTVAQRTPAFVEQVDPESIAGGGGCQPDDLIVSVETTAVDDVDSAGAAIVRALQEQGRAELIVLREGKVVTLLLNRDAP